MVYRRELTYDEIVDILDVKYNNGTTIGYVSQPDSFEKTDLNSMTNSLLLNEKRVNIKNKDIRLRTNLTTNKTMEFNKKSFLYTILGFIQSLLESLVDYESFIELIPRSNKSDKPFNITGVVKVHLKFGCIKWSTINGN